MNSTCVRKKRASKAKKTEVELIQLFWSAPDDARFGEDVIAAVTQRNSKTLQCDRWRKNGIPFSKVAGRVLYKKEHVVQWIESFAVCVNTSQYEPRKEMNHGV